MPTIRLNLSLLPPTARRRSIQVLRQPEAIAKFIRAIDWTESYNGTGPANGLVRVYEQTRTNGAASSAGYGVVLLPSGKSAHRLIIVHCWSSELEQARIGLEKITVSYLHQLAGGLEVAANIHLTELVDDYDQPKPLLSHKRKQVPKI
jgi:hypothetical protein